MSKIKYKLNLTTSEENKIFEGEGYLENEIISFMEDGFSMSLDMKNNIFVRDGEEIYIRYNFDKDKRTACELTIKKMYQDMQLEVETLEIKKERSKYYVVFEIVGNDKIIIDMTYEEEA